MHHKKILVPALALGALAAAGWARNPYVPFKDPSAIPARAEVLWRGDQKHVRLDPAGADEVASGVFRYQNVRWNYAPVEGEDRKWRVQFADATLDARRVRDVSLVWSPFFPRRLAGHAAMLLRFEPGGVTQTGGEIGGASPAASGIVISIEARMKDGEKYGFLKGLKGEFPLIYSVSTLENYRQRCITVYKSEMHRWKLALAPAEVRQVAQAALETAAQDHRRGVYKLTRRSCSTEFMDMLIDGLKRSQADAAVIADLEATLGRTREAPEAAVLAEAEAVAPKRRSFWRKFNPAYWLGITRDHVRRVTPHGIFVNPLMSLPAQLPGVLWRRKLLEDKRPYSVEIYEPTAEELEAAQAKKKGIFKKLFG